MEGRKMWNCYTSDGGVISKVLGIISEKFSIRKDLLKYLFSIEIEDIFKGKVLDYKKISKRRRLYALTVKNKKIIEFNSSEAQQIVEMFFKDEEMKSKRSISSLKGQIANKGIARGNVFISPMYDSKEAQKNSYKMKKGQILVAQSTNPDIMVLCQKAKAIITNQGGMLSHAAIISRELKIPCIVGTIYATKILKNGDLVKVDANRGIVRIIKRANKK
ncbi:MAG: PEP-utilizing enzyme [Candidatus Moranbacteria bacterium]|nr:PEP-utilizing enzyme [Candidatus Moranbacteria bacterium]